MRLLLAILATLLTTSGWAAEPVIKDGGTLQLAGTTYRLDGIDAPALDQMCVDDHADPWTCGLEARDRLARLTAKRDVRCRDLGADPTTGKRRIGICTVDGEAASLNAMLVREGFALNVEPSAKGRFKADEAAAKEALAGLWKGCFVAPAEFRRWQKTAPLLGAACRSDKDRELREILFPDDTAMPPGCPIKGVFAVRARVTGNLGIYQLQGCRGYAGTTRPNRWFCSEDDAQAAGFRKAYNCRGSRRSN
ncbi:MAG TPA: thermonuclease family protein [Bradyrhizobium sp.]|nr:thermonuclease family protein [Bradyrhizobium sp.]